jgi:hypothetical protein
MLKGMNMTDDTKQPEDIATMTPERAGELLTQMTKEFNAAEAARRAGLQPAEPPRPTDADGKPIPTPEGQIFLAPEERERRQMAETLDYLEANGAPMRDSAVGKDIWAYFDGRQPVTPEIQADVEKRATSCHLPTPQASTGPSWSGSANLSNWTPPASASLGLGASMAWSPVPTHCGALVPWRRRALSR